ncbi:MAG TPA: tetratricopeptide repeat protein [Phycisphaerales bacterium]|nr:tetratricopeptide repeat protein [Phycisphaerales bacterium]
MADRAPKRDLTTVALALVLVAVLVGGGWWLIHELQSPGQTGAASPSESAAPAPAGDEGAQLKSIQTVLDSARSYLKNMKPGSAETILVAAVAKWPTDQQLRFLYGETLLTLNKNAEAYEQYSKGITLGPEHPEYRHAAGTIAAGLGKLDDAESHFLVAQKLDPSSAKYPVFLGQVQRKLGKNDAARASFLTAAHLDPELAIAWGSLAGLSLDENHPSMARQHIARARKIEPTRIDWILIEAKALRRDNEPSKAADLLYAIPERERASNADLLSELALSLGLMGRVSDAASMYVEAARLKPDDPELNYQAALWLDRDNQRERARSYADEAARLGHDGAKTLVEAWKSES